jgi:hypothetical protein
VLQIHVHAQEQPHAWLYVQLVVVPSGRAHVHVQVHCPVCGRAAPVVGAESVGAVQLHCHVELDVAAAAGSTGACPVVHVQFQTHGVVPLGTTTCPGAPGMTTETTMLLGVVTVETVAAPEAGAPFSCVAEGPAPGLATRTETSTLLGVV